MLPPFRSRQEVVIEAPLQAVWDFNMDLRRIPDYHPRVIKVDLLSGRALRAPGVAYQCHFSGGKHTCVEKDIEIIPLQKVVTVIPEDSLGIANLFLDYTVETKLYSLAAARTRVEINHHYFTPTLKATLLHLLAKRKIARETQATLDAMKKAVEASITNAIAGVTRR